MLPVWISKVRKKGTAMTWIHRWLQGVDDVYEKLENLERNQVWGKMVKMDMLNLSLCLNYEWANMTGLVLCCLASHMQRCRKESHDLGYISSRRPGRVTEARDRGQDWSCGLTSFQYRNLEKRWSQREGSSLANRTQKSPQINLRFDITLWFTKCSDLRSSFTALLSSCNHLHLCMSRGRMTRP